MPDALAAALATDGIVFIGLAYLIAGVVRGFTGFGTALIVVPVAGIFMEPAQILAMIGVSGILSNIVLLPGAWGEADRAEVGVMAAAAILGVPLGVALLAQLDPVTIRWIVGGVALITLAAVISGWQWRRRLGPLGLGGIGLGAGTVGGLTALSGPVVVIFYLANARQAVTVRANMILFLAALDVLFIGNIAAQGDMMMSTILMACLVSVPYLVSIAVGQALFDPSREAAYRLVAYGVVAGAVLTGLPIWE